MERLAKDKGLFVALSCLSVGCLIGSFGYPLQKLEVWRQTEVGQFGLPYEQTFVITENDLNTPYGFNKNSAQLIAQIYEDYKLQKILLLLLAGILASSALSLGTDTVTNAEIDDEAATIKAQGRKELILEGIKHRLAMASKSQRLLFMDEMKALIAEFGTPEGEILEADEVNATDKFINASYLLGEGHSVDVSVSQTWGYKSGTPEHAEMKQKFLNWQSDDSENSEGVVREVSPVAVTVDFRASFPESHDKTYWKAICKALGDGLGSVDIVRDVLGCGDGQTDVGNAYLSFLKSRYLDG